MLWSKKKQPVVTQSEVSAVHIQSIPDIFYGGQDPEIYHSQSLNTDDTQSSHDIPRKTSKKSTNVHAQSGLFTNKKKFIIVGSVVFVLGVSAITWYYLADYYVNNQVISPQPNNTYVPPSASQDSNPQGQDVMITTTTPDISEEVPEPEVPTSTPSLSDAFINFPDIVIANTADADNDGLTDLEEEIFMTDSGTPDTDGDGYYDGQEVVNLYNPRGFAPVQLIESGVVQDYTNPYAGYRVYFPLGWEKGGVDTREQQVLFSALLGDYVEIRVFELVAGEDFLTWFGRNAEGQRYTDLIPITNRFEVDGWRRRDSLVAYFIDEQYVYVFVYHPRDRGPVAYRHMFQMMYQSFRMSHSQVEIPDQQIFVDTSISTNTPSILPVVTNSQDMNF